MNGKEKIEMIMAELKIKAPTLAKNIGLKYSRLFDILNGKTKKITADVAISISNTYPQYNLKWLTDDHIDVISHSQNTNSTLPGQRCTNPDCLNKIEQLKNDLKTANEDKILLKEHIALLKGQIEQLKTEKGAMPPEKRDSGSVEEPGENKKAS